MAITARLFALGARRIVRRLDELLASLSAHNERPDLELVRRAFDLAHEVHASQRRKGGDPYIVHPLRVAQACADHWMDDVSVAAALLHDTVEDADARLGLTRTRVDAEFGEDVADIVDGLTKLRAGEVDRSSDPKLETLKKVITASVEADVRAIVIKIFDRWDNARSLEVHAELKRRRIAAETLHFYVPIAHRLGFFREARDMEDSVLRVLQPEVYAALTAWLEANDGRVRRRVGRLAREVGRELERLGIACATRFYAKGLHSIQKGLEDEQIPLDRIDDGCNFNLCLVVGDADACFRALNAVHGTFVHLPGMVRDFVNNPKVNGYQSLHTTVTAAGIPKLQVLVRTQEMELASRLGVVSQLRAGRLRDTSWLGELVDSFQAIGADGFLEASARVAFAEIDVLTPKGEARKLPRGATALDFAYAIHTAIGDRAHVALIDGQTRPLRTVLRTGQRVEIVTADDEPPTFRRLEWVTTTRAALAIRRSLALAEKEGIEHALEGFYELCKRQLRHPLGPDAPELAALLRDLGLVDEVELGRELYAGRLDFDHLVPRLIGLVPRKVLARLPALFVKDGLLDESESRLLRGADERVLRSLLQDLLCEHLRGNAPPPVPIRVEGARYPLPVRLAGCCRPEHGDSIVAVASRSHGVTIHRGACREVRMLVKLWPAQMGNASWEGKRSTRVVHCELRGRDRRGLLAAVAGLLSGLKVDVESVEMRGRPDGTATGQVRLRLDDLSDRAELARRLAAVEGIAEVTMREV